MIMIDDENPGDVKEQIRDNDIQKNLHQRSASITFILIIFLPILLVFFNISCTPRRTLVESFQQFYGVLAFDLDSMAIVLRWLFIQVSIK